MANQLEHVRPGDVISSDYTNQIIDQLNDARDKLQGIDDLLPGPGKVAVPNLFGLALASAKAELTSTKYGLLVGRIFDTAGKPIYPENTDVLELPVLNQNPQAGKIIVIGSRIDLLIAHVPSEGNGPAEHRITGMEPPDGAHAGDRVTVIGEGFEEPYNRNKVYFDGVYEATPLLGSGPRPDDKIGLVVDIPVNIPNLPRDVQVAVQSYGITKVLPDLYPLEPEPAEPPLKIEEWQPVQPYYRVNTTITIIGTGFSNDPSENKITFIYAPNPEKSHAISGEGIVDFPNERIGVQVTIPEFPVGMRPATDGTQYMVTLHIGNDTENKATGMTIQIRPPL